MPEIVEIPSGTAALGDPRGYRCPLHVAPGELLADSATGLRCAGCGNVFPVRDAIPDLVVGGDAFQETEAKQWDEQAQRYELKRNGDAIYQAGINAVLAFFPPRGSRRVLDLGCGTGLTVRRYARPGLETVAVDLSLASLQELQRRVAPPLVQCLRAALDRLPLADNSFDAVLCANVLQHLPTAELRQQSIREMVRVLRPGGRLVISVHGYSRIKRRAGWAKEGAAGGSSGGVQYIYRFEPEEFHELLSREFQVERLVGAGLPLPYRWKLSPISRWLERGLRSRATASWAHMLVAVGHKRDSESPSPAGVR